MILMLALHSPIVSPPAPSGAAMGSWHRSGRRSGIRLGAHLSVVWMLAMVLSGCLSSPVMKQAIVSYDQMVADAHMDQILLNIVRVHHHHPVHFTAVSNVAATFDFRFNVGATPPLGGLEGGTALSPIFGGSAAENPTLSIYPIEGEEFTRRLMTPLDALKFYYLAKQGENLHMLLRLIARELRILEPASSRILPHDPEHRPPYQEVRRRLAHLAALHELHELFIQPLVYKKTWDVPLESEQVFQALDMGYEIHPLPNASRYRLGEKSGGACRGDEL